MVDHQAVQELAARMGYPEAALWVREHQHEYLEGVFRGASLAALQAAAPTQLYVGLSLSARQYRFVASS